MNIKCICEYWEPWEHWTACNWRLTLLHCTPKLKIALFKKCLFLCVRERECMHVHVHAGGGGERENLKQALYCQRRAPCGAWTHEPWDHDLSRNQESDAQLTEPPRRPQNSCKLLLFWHISLSPPLLVPSKVKHFCLLGTHWGQADMSSWTRLDLKFWLDQFSSPTDPEL